MRGTMRDQQLIPNRGIRQPLEGVGIANNNHISPKSTFNFSAQLYGNIWWNDNILQDFVA